MTRILTSGAAPGVIALALALLVLTYLLLSPGPPRLPRDRRRPQSTRPSALTGATDTATNLVDTILRRRGADNSIAAALENAGLTTRVQDFAFLVGIGALVAATIGLLALLELTSARFPARVSDDGEPVLLEDQDRSRWDRAQIDEGLAEEFDGVRANDVAELVARLVARRVVDVDG